MASPIEQNRIWQDFQIAELTLRTLFEERIPSGMLFIGPPGIGKTHLVRKVYKEYVNKEVIPFRGTSRGLVEHIYNYRDDILIFDDFDRAFYDPELLEIFKILLDTNEPRILIHGAKGPNALPPFQVTAGVVFCTNMNVTFKEDWPKRLWNVYINPLKSRISTSIMKLSYSPADVFEYTMWMAPTIVAGVGHVKRASGVHITLTKGHQDEIVNHFVKNPFNYPEHSPRMIYNLAKRRLVVPDDKTWNLVRMRFLHELAVQKEQEEKEHEQMKEEAEESIKRGRGTDSSVLLPHIPKK